MNEVAASDYFRSWQFVIDALKSCRKKPKKYSTYILLDTASGLYKIGKATDVGRRIESIKGMNPTIKLLASCSTNIERNLHKRFNSKKFKGEWFNLSDRDIDTIVKQFNFKRHG